MTLEAKSSKADGRQDLDPDFGPASKKRPNQTILPNRTPCRHLSFGSVEEIEKRQASDAIGDFRSKQGDVIDISQIEAKEAGSDDSFKYIDEDKFNKPADLRLSPHHDADEAGRQNARNAAGKPQADSHRIMQSNAMLGVDIHAGANGARRHSTTRRSNNHRKMIAFIVDSGADMDAVDRMALTPLQYASGRGAFRRGSSFASWARDQTRLSMRSMPAT